MAFTYPYRLNRRQFLHVNLETNIAFDRMCEDLAQTLEIHIGPQAGPWTTTTILEHFASKYGGSCQLYPVVPQSPTKILLKLPDYLRPDIVVQENAEWAVERDLTISMYRNTWLYYDLPTYHVKIKIWDYPLEFWDNEFFYHIVAGFGVLKEVEEVDDDGYSKGALTLWVECRDPYNIPECLIIDFWTRWCECKVEIVAWRLSESALTGTNGDRHLVDLLRDTNIYGDLYRTPFQTLVGCHQRVLSFIRRRDGGPQDSGEQQSHDQYPCSDTTWSTERQNAPRPCNNSQHYVKYRPGSKEYGSASSLLDKAKCQLELPRHHNYSPQNCASWVLIGQIHTPIKCDAINTLQLGDVLTIPPYHIASTTFNSMGPKPHIASTAFNYGGPKPNTKTHFEPTQLRVTIGQITIPLLQSEYSYTLSETNSLLTAPQRSTQWPTNRTMELSDEEFLAKFASPPLHATGDGTTVHQLRHSSQPVDWSLCLLMRVVADRAVDQADLMEQLLRGWKLSATVTCSSKGSNLFLLQFSSKEDLNSVLVGGPWSYRSEPIGMCRVSGHQDIQLEKITHVEMWVQFHSKHVDCIEQADILKMANVVGNPVSMPTLTVVAGQRYFRLRMALPIAGKLKDRCRVTHMTMGEFDVFIVYEKIKKICVFCESLGHLYTFCPNWARFSRMAVDPAHQHLFKGQQISPFRLGEWITNPQLLYQQKSLQSPNSPTVLPAPQPSNIAQGPHQQQQAATSNWLTQSAPTVNHNPHDLTHNLSKVSIQIDQLTNSKSSKRPRAGVIPPNQPK